MTRFVFVRHGQSEGNLRSLFIGQSNLPLTALGRMQAAVSRKYLENESFDRAVSSPLLRAYETGSIVLGDRELELTPEPALQEINGGDWEMKCFADLPKLFPEPYRIWMQDFGHAHPSNGESVAALGERALKRVLQIAKEHPDENILAASHATPIRMLRVASLGLPLEKAKEIPWPSNASISIFCVEDGALHCEAYGCDEHLGELRTHLPRLI